MDVSRCPLGVGRDAVTSASATDGLATGVGDGMGCCGIRLRHSERPTCY